MKLNTILIILVALLVIACGTFEIGIEPTAITNQPGATGNPIQPTLATIPQPQPASPSPTTGTDDSGGSSSLSYRLAYIGWDGNIWVLDRSGQPFQITTDAASGTPGQAQPDETIMYSTPSLSPDGTFLAYRRDVGVPIESGLSYTFGLWVYDIAAGQARQISDQRPAGFAWKPGTHLLAYGLRAAEGYLTSRGGKPNADLATGILGWDQDLGQSSELVAPERGYTLVLPQWSPDGQLLSFDEVYLMEGRGMFAYYDFQAGKYVAWDEPIGTYSWSPDGGQIAYDGKTYAPNGEERIFLNDRAGSEERVISPALDGGYAFDPIFSPQGDRIAYLVAAGGPDTSNFAVYVQELAGGEPRSGEPGSRGEYEGVQNLAWTPDGSRLVFSAGPYESQQVYELNPVDGAGTVLAQGGLPSVAAVSPNPNEPLPQPGNPSPTAVPTAGPQMVQIFLIAVGDNGVSGDLIGCGDSVVPVQVEIPPTQGVLKAAFQALLAVKDQFYGQSGLYNSLYQSDLQLESAKIENGKATIRLTGSLQLGGECDNPRVAAQLEQTARQFSTVTDVSIFINDKTLADALSLK
jgi:Tol biopolymer transport system component